MSNNKKLEFECKMYQDKLKQANETIELLQDKNIQLFKLFDLSSQVIQILCNRLEGRKND